MAAHNANKIEEGNVFALIQALTIVKCLLSFAGMSGAKRPASQSWSEASEDKGDRSITASARRRSLNQRSPTYAHTSLHAGCANTDLGRAFILHFWQPL